MIVAKKITKTGKTLNGSYFEIVVVKTDPGYAPGPLNQGNGKIVATFCQPFRLRDVAQSVTSLGR